jgi:hypothetical protein
MSRTQRGSRRSSVRAIALEGRAGNNLFQYAFLRAVTPDEEPVLFDDIGADPRPLLSMLRRGRIRRVTASEAYRLRRPWLPEHSNRRLSTALDLAMTKSYRAAVGQPLRRHLVFEPTNRSFHPNLREDSGPALFLGYFQDERYFRARAQSIVDSIESPSPQTLNTIERYRETPTIGVSIRAGGDYERAGWRLPIDWYKDQLLTLLEYADAESVLVFSDVPAVAEAFALYVRERLHAESFAQLSALDQLHLMACCRHMVIGSSTFAWWGAWLGDATRNFGDPDRIVLAPLPWIRESLDPVPRRWHRAPLS